MERIHKLQKYAARIICDEPYDSPSLPLFEKLDWLNIYERTEYNKGVLLYKCVNGLSPSYLSDFFQFQNNGHHQLRSSSNFGMYIPRPNHEIFKKSFQYSGALIWNNLPSSLRTAPSLYTFKKSLTSYIKSKRD